MGINAFVKAERNQKSPCCGARIQIKFKTSTTERTAVVYECNVCQRLYVVDSRDEKE